MHYQLGDAERRSRGTYTPHALRYLHTLLSPCPLCFITSKVDCGQEPGFPALAAAEFRLSKTDRTMKLIFDIREISNNID